MKKILVIICFGLVFCGCGTKDSNNLDKDNSLNLEEVIENNNYIVVDVRTKDEYESAHVKNAINIPYDEIDEDSNLDKEKIILVYCQSGRRSNIAYNTLKNLGYEVIDLGAFDSVTLEKE